MTHGQQAGNAGPLFLPVTQVVDILGGQIGHFHRLQGTRYTTPDLFFIKSHIARAKGYVLIDRMGKQLIVGILEYQSDLAVDLTG